MRRCFGWVIQPRKRRFCWIFRYILNSMVKKSTLLKGNLCNYKCFIDALISTFFVQWLQNAPRFWDRFCAEFCYVLCRFYLRWWIHNPDNLTLIGKNFRITPCINYAFCVINNASALLSSKTMVNSPEYCIYTSVMNTYCVSKKGFQFLSSFIFFHPSLSLFSPLIHLPLSPVPPGFLFPFFFSVVGEIWANASL